ncbi:MAG: metalloregulator ArsR/SmtB family transcription factor [Candidatus Pacebacteria bacterium]|nr:metalloregulator ArsR/SmtB family transcription factor [Candidatus Paceibacterota bacterium]MDR3583516.1 metalloregulator ArsR/SmtB family transcription factor [Candidatus Paceibacterota bacterium]
MKIEFQCCAKNSSKQKDVGRTYAFLKTIADKNRLKILCILKEGPKCVCEIFPAAGISQKLASHHLNQLKKIGLLEEKRDGNFIRYNLNRKLIREYKKIFNQIIK